MNSLSKTFYRRNLPHYQPPGGTFFITFRLAGSLPRETVCRLQHDHILAEELLLRIKDSTLRRRKTVEQRKRYFAEFDKFLDKAIHGPVWLQDDRVAGLVAEAIHYRDGKQFDLIAFTIMPNHVHAVLTVERNGISLYRILQSLKRNTALKANNVLGRSGAFWQHESYDHVIRNEKELERVIWYVLSNPVKAVLVQTWQEWKWSYCKLQL